MSASVLSRRLAELGEAGIVDSDEAGYGLTGEGRSLLGVCGRAGRLGQALGAPQRR